MSTYNSRIQTALSAEKSTDFSNGITIGQVIDTNDPQQMGRLRVFCPFYGDSGSIPVPSLPWAMYASPFAGITETGSRGRGDDQTNGPVAYGMWNIPKVGSHVLVGCIDGDPSQRFWFGAIYPGLLQHTMPHGRYMDNDGPKSSTEDNINPLYDNQTAAFSQNGGRSSKEWLTRGKDNQVGSVTEEFIDIPGQSEVSNVPDIASQGYGASRVEPDIIDSTTDNVSWDSQTYSWTTPGFHSFAMTDKAENCRIRFRTTGGHQIIMDDTNERIYISSAQGNTWIEIDEKGTIDIFSSQDFSVRANGDINFSTQKSFRVSANQGIHLASGTELRLFAATDTHSYSGGSLKVHSISDMALESNGVVGILAGSQLKLSTNGTMHLLASSNVLVTGSQIHLNGPSASSADNANEKTAYATSRIPNAEGWARVYTSKSSADVDNRGSLNISAIQSEYSYSDDAVGHGSADRSVNFNRNPRWHR